LRFTVLSELVSCACLVVVFRVMLVCVDALRSMRRATEQASQQNMPGEEVWSNEIAIHPQR